MVRSLGAGTPGSATVQIDGRALAFAAVTSLVSVLVIGALPASRAARVSLTEPLKEGAGGAGRSGRQQRARSALVVGEIALALMLVIAAGLLVRSFWRLNNVDPGFNTHQLVAIDLSPPGPRYAESAQAGAFYTRLLDAVRAVPGVERAALTNHMPLNGSALPVSVQIAGRAPDPEHDPQVLFRTISPDYIGTLGIPLRSGRNFTPADLTSGTAVLVNQKFAASFWPGAEAIGRRVMLHKSAQSFADLGEPLPGIVVGVIGDVRHFGVQADPVAEIYIPYLRNPWGHMVVVSRVRGHPEAMIPGLRRAILSVDPATRVDGGSFGGFAVMDDIRDGGTSAARFNMMLLASFSLCALLLSAIGIYGLMAYCRRAANARDGDPHGAGRARIRRAALDPRFRNATDPDRRRRRPGRRGGIDEAGREPALRRERDGSADVRDDDAGADGGRGACVLPARAAGEPGGSGGGVAERMSPEPKAQSPKPAESPKPKKKILSSGLSAPGRLWALGGLWALGYLLTDE